MPREAHPPWNDYVAWETQGALAAAAPAAVPTRAGHRQAAVAAVSDWDNEQYETVSPLVEQILMEQLGAAPTVMLGTYYSEKMAVACSVPAEAGGELSIMQDPGSEQRGHGEAGGVVWKCAATMVWHLCDRRYFAAGFWVGKRCLEIGAGTGILGLGAARLGAEVIITDYGELSELIAHNITRNLTVEQAERTRVDSLDWNQPGTARRFPAERWDVILISDVVWADGYGNLPQLLTQIAAESTLVVLGFEQRAHKRPELASPTFIPTLARHLSVQEVEFPEEHQREHLFVYHITNDKSGHLSMRERWEAL